MADKVIGKIVVASGEVLIHRDGKTIAAKVGTELLQGDMISTSGDGKAGIAMIDDSRFSLGAKASMKLDEMTFNDTTKTGSMTTSVVKGAFMFVTGSIAKSPGDEPRMKVRTSTATIAVRGTEVAGEVSGGTVSRFTLLPNPDGHKSFAQISNAAGTITIDQPNQTVDITGYFAPPSEAYQMPPSAVSQNFSGLLSTMTSVSQATGLPPPVNQQTYTPPAYVPPAQTNNADAQKTILVSATTNLSLDQLITAKIETNPTLNQARTEAALIQNANTQAITQQAVVQNIARQLTISELIAVRNSVNGNYIFADTKVVQTIGGNTVTFYVPSIANVILNIPPSASPDTASVIETRLTPKTGSVLTNDIDPDNNPGALRVLAYTSTNLAGLPGAIGSVVAGQFGSLSISSAGNYLYMVDTGKAQVYAPPPGSVVSDVFNYTISDAASNGSSTVTFSVDLSTLTTRTGLTFSSTVVSTSTAATNSVSGDVTTTDKVVSGDFLNTALVTGVATEKNYTAGDEVISAGNKIVGDFGALTLNPSGTYSYQIDPTKTNSIALGSFVTDDFVYTLSNGQTATLTVMVEGLGSAGPADLVSFHYYYGSDTDPATAGHQGSDYYIGYAYVKAGTFDQYVTGSNVINTVITESGNQGFYTIDSVTQDQVGLIGLVNVTSYHESVLNEDVTPYMRGLAGIGSEEGTVAVAGTGANQGNWVYDYANYYFDAHLDKSTTTNQIQYYTFTYTYADGDYYSGYGYAASGYSANQTITSSTISGIAGSYTIEKVFTIEDTATDNIHTSEVFVTSYYDANGAQSNTTTNASGDKGLGSERGNIFSLSTAKGASFDAASSATISNSTNAKQLYYFHYDYVSGDTTKDSYYGYGYTTSGTYTQDQTWTLTSELGTARYTIDQVYSSDAGKLGDVVVTNYYDSGTDHAGHNTTVSGSGNSGLGSELGFVQNSLLNKLSDSFSSYYEANVVADVDAQFQNYNFHFSYYLNSTIANVALTSNVATITTSTAHGYSVGDTVIVDASNNTFDGTHTITAVTSTTFSYAKTNTNITSALATGSTLDTSKFGDIYYGSGTALADTYAVGEITAGQATAIKGEKGIYTIDSVKATSSGINGEVIITKYYDHDTNAAGWNTSVDGTGSLGLGSEKGSITNYTGSKADYFNPGSEATLSSSTAANQLYYFHFTYTTGDIYYGSGTAALNTYTVGNITTAQANSIIGEDGVYTIDSIYDTNDGQQGDVSITSYYDAQNLGWNNSVKGSGKTGLGSEAGTIYDASSKANSFTTSEEANITSTAVTSALQLYYYHYTYNTGDIYYGYGYHSYAADKTITNVALTSNVATITTSAAHGYQIGDIVTVDASNNTFDGTHTITAVTSTTFQYAKTYSGTIASAVATGSASDAYTSGETISKTAGAYTIDWVYDTTSGSAGEVNIYAYYDADKTDYTGVGWNLTTTGSSKGGLGSEKGTATDYEGTGATFNIGAEADFESGASLKQLYYFHFTYAAGGDTYYGYGYNDSSLYTSGQTLNSIKGADGTYTIDYVYKTAKGNAGEVNVYSYFDADTTGYTGIGWNSSVQGVGSTGLGSEKGTLTSYDTATKDLAASFNAGSSANFEVAAAGSDQLQLYYYHYTYNTGDIYYGYGYHSYAADKTITNVALTSNVATITTSAAHGYQIGDIVTVDASNNTFDGTHTITAVTSTTFQYAKTYSGTIASAVATGSASDAYTSGETISKTAGAYTIDWVYDTTSGSAGEVNIYAYYDADKTDYTGVGWNLTTTGSSKGGLGSEKGTATDYEGTGATFNIGAEADFESGASLKQLYYFHFTYAAGGDTYYGYGYNDSSLYTSGQTLNSIKGADGTYTIDYVYKTAKGNAGEVNVYSYFDADTTGYTGIGWNSSVQGVGSTGLGSEKGTLTSYDTATKDLAASFNAGSSANFEVAAAGSDQLQLYYYHFTYGVDKTINNVALTSNVATITTSASHGYSVGDIVTVDASNNAFDGTYTITAVTSTTFQYAKTYSGTIASVENTGTSTNITLGGGDVYYGYGYHSYAADKTITNVALTSNVATITTSGSHGYSVGDIVTVDASNNTFDGTYTITAVTSTTFSYAKTNNDVTSIATGSVSDAYTSGETISKTAGAYTIDWVYDTSSGSAGEVNVYSYYDADKTDYTGVGWNTSTSGSGTSDLGSEKGKATDYQGNVKQFDNKAGVDFASGDSLLQLYYFHFTYKTGDIYYGYGYNDSNTIYTTNQTLSSISGTNGTYTIDYVYKSAYGTAGEVQVYSYYDAAETSPSYAGSGWQNTVTGSGLKGLGSESGSITNTIDVGAVTTGASRTFSAGTEADFVAKAASGDFGIQYYQFHFTFNAKAVAGIALSNNVATITTSGAHGYSVGDRVSVDVDGQTLTYLNGTVTVTNVTSNTFSYALTHTSITSAAATGTVTKGGDTYYGSGYQIYTLATTDSSSPYTLDSHPTVSVNRHDAVINHVELTSNIATITTSVNHGYSVGDIVTVDVTSNNTFDGTYTITAATDSTFSYAKTYSGTIASAVDSGTAALTPNGIYTIDSVAETDYGGSVGQVWVSSYTTFNNTNLVASAIGHQGIGSEQGSVIDANGTSKLLDNTGTNSTGDVLQYYTYHFTYNTGDIYYGYGYHHYTIEPGGNSPYAVGSFGTFTVGSQTTLGTYTIDYVADTVYGTQDAVYIYSYNDVDGVGTKNSVTGFGSNDLGSEKGVVTDFSGAQESFNNYSNSVTGLTSAATLQYYQFHFTYTSGDIYYGYGYHSYSNSADAYTVNQHPSVTGALGTYTIDYVYDTTYGTPDQVYVYQYNDSSTTSGAADGVGTRNSVTASGKLGLGSESGTVTDFSGVKETFDKTDSVTTLHSTASMQQYQFHFVYTDSGDTYYGYGYNSYAANKTINNVALTSNEATITTSAAHGYQIGDIVTVDASNNTFDGTYTITAVTSTTFQYAKTYSGTIASVTATGSASDAYTANETIATANGTYTIDSIYDTTYGNPDQVVVNSYYDKDGVGYVGAGGLGFGGLGSEKGFVFAWEKNTNTVAMFNSASDADLSTFTNNPANATSAANYALVTTTNASPGIYDSSTNTYVSAGTGVDMINFNLSDNSNLTLSNAIGFDVVNLQNDVSTTYKLDITFDDVYRSDNKMMLIMGAAYDDTIQLSTKASSDSPSNFITWNNLKQSIYNGDDGYYYDIWQGSDRKSDTSDVALLIRQNIEVTVVDPDSTQFFRFHYTYASGDVYSGTGYAAAGTYSAGQTINKIVSSSTVGTYTIDAVSSKAGTAGTVTILQYQDIDGVGPNNTVTAGSGTGGLGTETGGIVKNANNVSVDFTTAIEADFVQKYNFHFTYTSGDIYEGYVYADVGKYVVGNLTTLQADAIIGEAGVYTIDSITATVGQVDQVTVTRYKDVDGTGYNISTGVGVYTSVYGSGLLGLGSESGSVKNTDGLKRNFDTKTEADFIASNFTGHYQMQYYQFHFTYNTASGRGGETYAGGGYNLYTTETTDSLSPYTVNQNPTITNAQGTYTIDSVSDTTYGTPGQVYFYNYTTSNGSTLSASGNGYQGLGSEKGSVTNTSGVSSAINNTGTTSASLMQYYQFHFTYTDGDSYTGYGYHNYTKAANDAYVVNQNPIITDAQGTYTIDYVFDTTYGTSDQVYVYQYNDSSTTSGAADGVGTRNSATGSGSNGLGSESGAVTDFSGVKETFDKTDSVTTLHSTASMQQYQFQYTYASGGDTYSGYGYNSYAANKTITHVALTSNVATITTSAAHGYQVGDIVTVDASNNTFDGNYIVTAKTDTTFSYAKTYTGTIASVSATGSTSDAYTANETIATANGTYTISYVYDTTYGTPDQVNVYSYSDTSAGGVGSNNSVIASGSNGLGSESGAVTDFSGVKETFDNTDSINTLNSTAKLQQYQFHFSYTVGGDVYYGYGYNSYAANKTITHVALTSNVATITTSAAHGYQVGDIVTVDASNNTFDGNYIVTAKTDTTFSYAKTYTGTIASVSATGSTSDAYTANETIATANGTYTIDSIYDTTWGVSNQVSINNYYDADGIGYVSGGGVGNAGLGSEKGFVIAWDDANTLGAFNATSDADLSSLSSTPASLAANGAYTAVTASETVAGGAGVDKLSFNVADNTTLSLSNVTGIDIIDLQIGLGNTQNLKINFDDAYNADNKIMMVKGHGYDDTINLITTSATAERGVVTWTQNKNAGGFYNAVETTYYEIWQGSDSNSTTSDVIVLVQQNIAVSLVDDVSASTTQFFRFQYTYASGDVYSGTGYAAAGTYSVGQTIDKTVGSTIVGTYTIDAVSSKAGTAGTVNVISYNDVDGVGTSNTVTAGSGTGGLGSESGTIQNVNNTSANFTISTEADFKEPLHYALQYYQFHFTYNTASGRGGETYAGGGYNLYTTETTDSLSPYTVNQNPTITNAQGTYTIDSVSDTTYGTPGQVYFYNYTTSNGSTLSASGNGYQGLGSEKGSVTNTSGVSSAINNTGTTSASLMQYYQFYYTYNHINNSGDVYSGYGYHNYAANKTIASVALTSNVATISTSAAHGYSVGDIVTVDASIDTFDGNYIVSAKTDTTFSYTKTNTDITRVAATGSTSDAYTANQTITTANGTYTISYVYASSYGTDGQVNVYNYNDVSNTRATDGSLIADGVGTKNSATGSGTNDLGSESGTVTDFSGAKESFDNTDSVTTLYSTANMQYYQFHFVYADSGDTYYGYGYHSYTNTADAYTVNQDLSVAGALGTYTIDYVYDTTYGIANQVSVYSYRDTSSGGVGSNNSVTASGKLGLGSESGTVTDFGGAKETFSNTDSVTTLYSTAKLQQYQFHFVYTDSGDVYYGSGYHSYSSSTDIYTMNQVITNTYGQYTIDAVYDTTWGVADHVSVRNYYDKDGVGFVGGGGAGFAGLGSETGIIFDISNGDKLGVFNATSDADVSLLTSASTSSSANGAYTTTSLTPTADGGAGVDQLSFNVADNASISLSNVTGIDFINLERGIGTTRHLKISFDDVFDADNKTMVVIGQPNDDIIDLNTQNGSVTWTLSNDIQSIASPDNNYLQVWQGSDSNSATADVMLLLQQNILVNQVAA